MHAYGIPTANFRLAQDVDEACLSAEKIGYPVVLKATGPDLVHKSDVGAVAVDLRSPDEFGRALTEMNERLKAAGLRADRYLVQEFTKGGREVIFGVSSDPRMGPILMFGLGGKYVEVFRDVRFAIPPLEPDEALSVVQSLHGHKLLEGVRGEKPVDFNKLADVLLRLGQLVQRHPRIAEIDINPFLAIPENDASRAVDVRIRVANPASGEPILT